MDCDDEIVRLNVGGQLFSTTKRTLLSAENSIFGQILNDKSGKNDFESSMIHLADGSLFIDRDGCLFAFVLEYLRLRKLILPENFQNFARLQEEARFYRLDELEQQIVCYNSNKYQQISDVSPISSAETGNDCPNPLATAGNFNPVIFSSK